MGVWVKRPVRVVVVVTEAFKEQRTSELRSALARLAAVAKRLEAELRSADQAETERLSAQQRRNDRARAAVTAELEKLRALEPGALFQKGAVEGTVELNVGDDLSKLQCTLVVKDDKIIDICEGPCPNRTGIS